MQSKNQLLLLTLGKVALVSIYFLSVYYFIKEKKPFMWMLLVGVFLLFIYVLINTKIEALERKAIVHKIYKQFGIDS